MNGYKTRHIGRRRHGQMIAGYLGFAEPSLPTADSIPLTPERTGDLTSQISTMA